MAYIIALAGKGGTGKTTIAGLTVRYLIEKKKKPVLAVDADANSCLNQVSGPCPCNSRTIKGGRSSGYKKRRGKDQGMSMEQLFDYQIQQSLIESRGYDLLVMGRPEGPGCYCAANNIIRKYTDKLADTYSYVVIDNEAGMEHLSRRTTDKVNPLLIVSDPSKRGIHTAKRIDDLVDELQLEIDSRIIITNRVAENDMNELKQIADGEDIQITGHIPRTKPSSSLTSRENLCSNWLKILLP